MKIKEKDKLPFFDNIPDKLFVYLAENEWESLERLCFIYTLDVQLFKEGFYKEKKKVQ
jgi:hypothetical protein